MIHKILFILSSWFCFVKYRKLSQKDVDIVDGEEDEAGEGEQ